MQVSLTEMQIKGLLTDAHMETQRDIYSITFTISEITINGSWSTNSVKLSNFRNSLIEAIEDYCTKDNIEWENNSEYSTWCD